MGDPDAEYDPLLTMMDISAAWLQHFHTYYVKNGQCTSEVSAHIAVQKYLLKLYCDLPTSEFGPKRLLAVRQFMIAAGLARKSINKNIGRIKRMFAWASEVEMIDPLLYHRLQCVKGLMPGRGGVELPPRRPATLKDFLTVANACPPTVAAMMHLQWHTGMRPGEARILRTGDIDRSGSIWLYRSGSFKTQYHSGKFRAIALGHNAQMILTPWLRDDDPAAWCFPARGGRPYSKDKTTDSLYGSYCLWWNYQAYSISGNGIWQGPKKMGGRDSELMATDYFGFKHWLAGENTFASAEPFSNSFERERHANFGKFLFSMKVSGLAEINDIQSSLSAGYTDSHVETFTPHEAMNVRVNITEGERMYGRFFIPFP